MQSGSASLTSALPSCANKVAVRLSGGCCGAGSSDDFADCQIAEIDGMSLPGRCDAGMSMTRTAAMPAATTTAIDNLSATLNSARRPDMSRSTDGASTSVGSIDSCKAWATALLNNSEFS